MFISNSDNNISFRFSLDSIIRGDQYNIGEYAWLIFLQDHREYLIQHSTLTTITPNEMAYYKYRIRKYITYKGYNSDYDKVFRVINRLPQDSQFNENVTQVYLPDTSTVAELRRLYQTLKTQQLQM